MWLPLKWWVIAEGVTLLELKTPSHFRVFLKHILD